MEKNMERKSVFKNKGGDQIKKDSDKLEKDLESQLNGESQENPDEESKDENQDGEENPSEGSKAENLGEYDFNALSSSLDEVQKELDKAEYAYKKVLKHRDKLRAARDKIIEERERNEPKDKSQLEIKRYLKSQAEQRKKLAESSRASALDQAFGRPNARPAPRMPNQES